MLCKCLGSPRGPFGKFPFNNAEFAFLHPYGILDRLRGPIWRYALLSNKYRYGLHACKHRLPIAVPSGHILAASAASGMMRFAFQIPPAIRG